MRRLFSVAVAVALALLPGRVPAQDAGLVVGSGNFFSPIVANLERAVALYRDGLGLDVTGNPSNATDNAPLRNMFGLPDAQLRWTVARWPGVRNGVEIVEIGGAGGRPLDRRISDPGAMTLVASTPDDLDQVSERLTQHGAVIVSAPVKQDPGGRARVLVARDPDDHFVQLFGIGRTATPLPPRIRLTVRTVDKAVALYRDALGLRPTAATPVSDDILLTALGLARGGASASVLEVAGSGLLLELVQFNAKSRAVTGRLQDPGSTRLQLQVRDLDAAVAAVVRAGGHVISTGGQPVELPAGRGTPIKAAIVQDPDNLFLVLIQSGR
jgi:catechol 2,3-dioxygenase-like lactoylglutathione lyase family enzyme